ncbi:MAG: isoaspartyl peptidase/L-asparaginase, partial [Candidatus Krumholzibacteriia bacterium]
MNSNRVYRTIMVTLLLAGLAWGCVERNGTEQARAPKQRPIAIVVHGGAGTILRKNMTPEREKAYRDALTVALETGYEILEEGG